jgi:hypothetical protein
VVKIIRRELIINIVFSNLKSKSLSLLKELKKTQKTPSFLTHYKNFISILADHLTLVTPFIRKIDANDQYRPEYFDHPARHLNAC